MNLGPFGSGPSDRKPYYILRPVSKLFIVFSLACALLLNLAPWGRWVGVPDWVALVLVFWNVHYPRKVGIGSAFVLGLVTDVHDAALFGEHALAYTLLSYGAIALHKRMQWSGMLGQMSQVLPLLALAQVASIAVRMVAGAAFPGVSQLLDSVVATLLWPFATWLLFAPQRRPINRDLTRPL